ncbi:GntR family transcriptional regulator [Puniceibacterium sp. IMCC21224]|uniref:GntR family transcriptional regulator n=1 Tax=Puniceibacterium sp. IMCC21224 TaxID=1618204 RepID=UPI001E61A498|nr:GntR family transcriptional regulator [Puniceibacterium sp. IMCC21224]
MSAKLIGPRRATLAGEVRNEIERMLVDGDLVAGEKLNELALSNAMGVSRGTVREAIRSLVDSGLIDLIANRGAFVHETTVAEVRNLYDLRGAIFAMACSSSAQRVAEGIETGLPAQLQNNLDQMQEAHGRNDTELYYKLNIEFHDMLLGAAGNPKAKTIYDNLVREMHLFRRRGLSIASNIARSIAEHQVISAAVTNGDVEAARAAAQMHIVSGLARYMKILDKTPESEG